jgi:hypothetical protein
MGNFMLEQTTETALEGGSSKLRSVAGAEWITSTDADEFPSEAPRRVYFDRKPFLVYAHPLLPIQHNPAQSPVSPDDSFRLGRPSSPNPYP